MFADGGLRLHPDTVEALGGGDRRSPFVLPLWIAVVLLAILVLAVI
jgi:hypothetical protein